MAKPCRRFADAGWEGDSCMKRGGRRRRGRLQDDRHGCVQGCMRFCTSVGAHAVLLAAFRSNSSEAAKLATSELGDVAARKRARFFSLSLSLSLFPPLLSSFPGSREWVGIQRPLLACRVHSLDSALVCTFVIDEAEPLPEAGSFSQCTPQHVASSSHDKCGLGGTGASSDTGVSLDSGAWGWLHERQRKARLQAGVHQCVASTPTLAHDCGWTPSVGFSPSSRTPGDDRVQHAPYA